MNSKDSRDYLTTKALLGAALDRLDWLDKSYTAENDVHSGIRLAVCMIRGDIEHMRKICRKAISG